MLASNANGFHTKNYNINETENNTPYYIYTVETDNEEDISYRLNVNKDTERILFAGVYNFYN